MIIKYNEYSEISPELEFFIQRMNELRYRYYASELLKKMLRTSDFNLDAAVRRAIAILRVTGIPVQEHCVNIYRSDPTGVKRDWKLSELACGLILLSYESSDPEFISTREIFIEYLGI